MERVNKIFIKKNKRFIKRNIKLKDYYLLSEMFRKEFLSDLLEYESLLTETIIIEFDLERLTIDHMKNNNIYFFNSLENKYKANHILSSTTSKEIKVSNIFSSLSFGNKIKIIKMMDKKILSKKLKDFLLGYKRMYPKLNNDKLLLEQCLFPTIEYIKNIRNRFAHNRFLLEINRNFLISYNSSKKKYKLKKLLSMVDEQLYLIHSEKFIRRFKKKVYKNKKISNRIFKEILFTNNYV